MLKAIGDWLDARTGWRAPKQGTGSWMDHPVAGGAVWARAMAASVATCFGVLVLTGIVLMTSYAPAPQTAWASVHYLQYVADRGWILRGLHYWAAQTMLVLGVLHVAHGALTASYRAPREIAWWLTLAVPALVVGQGITGGLLPWDQRGWWARAVEGNIAGLAPVLGGFVQRMMEGGAELGAVGLARAYAAHVILLPALIGAVLWFRHAQATRNGWAAGSASATEPRARAVARHVWIAAAVVALLFAFTGVRRGAPLDAPADPLSDYPARPEWFLYTLFELRKFFHGTGEFWGTTLLPGAAALFIAALPFIDRTRASRGRALVGVLAVFGAAAVVSALPFYKDAHDPQYAKQRRRADAQAARAATIAMQGVPPAGALFMIRHDVELRGHDLFERHCAACHVLGDSGDPKKATASKLDGWGTPQWIASMIHDPDAPEFFGRGPYNGLMPSVDQRPPGRLGEHWVATIKTDAEKRAVAVFLAAEGDEPGEPPTAIDAATRAQAQKIVSERCTTCHLYKGEGDDEGSGLSPELGRYGSVAWTRAQIANPSSPQTYREKSLDPELKKHMPRYDKDLSAEDIDIVARWTRAHARGIPLP
jgi:ubiquinol-cytochrome c reductase cytochrome b subunit